MACWQVSPEAFFASLVISDGLVLIIFVGWGLGGALFKCTRHVTCHGEGCWCHQSETCLLMSVQRSLACWWGKVLLHPSTCLRQTCIDLEVYLDTQTLATYQGCMAHVLAL